jgi:hypothetical protein
MKGEWMVNTKIKSPVAERIYTCNTSLPDLDRPVWLLLAIYLGKQFNTREQYLRTYFILPKVKRPWISGWQQGSH